MLQLSELFPKGELNAFTVKVVEKQQCWHVQKDTLTKESSIKKDISCLYTFFL